MIIKQNGVYRKITKKSVRLSSPSVIKAKREAFERKKKTKAFRVWRYKQYKQVQKGLCYYCHLPIEGVWTCDHLTPISRGGTSAYKNLVVSCFRCNKLKGVKFLKE